MSVAALTRPFASAAIFVCESVPYWTPELQRQFLHSAVVVRGCRKWDELIERSAEFSAVVQVVDFDDRAAECVVGLRRRAAQEACPLIVIASPQWAPLEFVLREAGVNAFFAALPTGTDLARCCRRWLDESTKPGFRL